jgi:hypothetical protein
MYADNTSIPLAQRVGILGFGPFLGIIAVAAATASLAGPFEFTRNHFERLSFFFLYASVITFPIAMWVGYFWGTVMGRALGARHGKE